MAATRIRGQEVEVRIISDGDLERTITAVQSFDMEAQLEVKSEGYLGETTMRKDDIYNGVRIRMTLHLENDDWFDLQRKIIDRARRRTPAVEFNIIAVLFFPNGDTPRVSIPDVSFGTQPLTAPGRGDYVSVTLEGEAADFDIL